jgi:DNA-binding transcriptional LysR family regulator
VRQGVNAGYNNPPDTDTPHCNGKNYSNGIKATTPSTQERLGNKGKKTTVKPQDLQDLVWILREIGSGTRAFTDQFIKSLGLAVKKTYVFSSHQGVKEAVNCGLGVAIVSRLIVQRKLTAG